VAEAAGEADPMAEQAATGAVGLLDALAQGGGALLGEVAGGHRGIDGGDGSGLAGGDEPVAIGAELGCQGVHEDVAVLAGGRIGLAVLGQCRADQRSADQRRQDERPGQSQGLCDSHRCGSSLCWIDVAEHRWSR
jgi:hypothetical protein